MPRNHGRPRIGNSTQDTDQPAGRQHLTDEGTYAWTERAKGAEIPDRAQAKALTPRVDEV